MRLQKIISSLVDPLMKIPGKLTFVDFENAFDTLQWSFLFDTLNKFNFGENFIKWIKLLYVNVLSCISNNGHISKYVTLSRGIRQGCPISALLFILVAEFLAINIRTDTNIKGITINGSAFKIGQLGDHTTLFLADLESLGQAINMFNKFSGLKLNVDKMEIVSLGGQETSFLQLTGVLEGSRVVTGPFKTFGVWFTCDSDLSVCLKVTILKTPVVPQVIYLFSNIYTPIHFLEKINELFFEFLWSGKLPRVRKSTIISNYDKGGLKMPDIYSIHTSQKVMWLKCLTNDNNRKWKTLPWALLGMDKDLLDLKLFEGNYKVAKTKYCQQLLDTWVDLFPFLEEID